MIWTLKIKLADGIYAEESCVKHLEVGSEISLYELHVAILDAIRFDNDHLFEFFIGRNCRNHSRLLAEEDDFNFDLDSDHGGIYRDIKLKDVFAEMPTGMKLIYHFDFGDDWMFEITKMQS